MVLFLSLMLLLLSLAELLHTIVKTCVEHGLLLLVLLGLLLLRYGSAIASPITWLSTSVRRLRAITFPINRATTIGCPWLLLHRRILLLLLV